MKVPEYERLVQQQDIPNVKMESAVKSGADLLNPLAMQAASSLGTVAKDIENTSLNLYQQQEKEANDSRVIDARDQFSRKMNAALYDPTQGALSVQGESAFKPDDSGQNVGQRTMSDLQTHAGDISASLSNDYQRREFEQWKNQQLTHVDGVLQQHEGQQMRVYQRGVDASDIETRQQTIELNNNNTVLMDSNIAGIKQASIRSALREGLDAKSGELQAQAHISTALKSAADRAMATGHSADAFRILHDYSKEMTPNDMLNTFSKYSKGEEGKQVMGSVQAAMQDHQAQIYNYPLDRIMNITPAAESSNRQFNKDGTVVTSPAGAIGKWQVMPATGPEAAKLAGLPWDENKLKNDENYNEELGKAYLNKQLQDFGGDPEKAWAAYNAGPAATQAAIDAGGNHWLSLLPSETQSYVKANKSALDAGEGNFQRPTLEEVQASSLKYLNAQNPNASADSIKEALSETSRRYEVETKSIKQRDDYAVNQVYKALISNGGNLNALPLDLKNSIPPDQYDNVLGFSGKLAKDEPLQNVQSWAQIMTLTPSELSKMTPESFYATYRNQLDNSHMDKGMALVKEAQGEGGDTHHLEIITTQNRIKQAAQEAAILPMTGKPSGVQAQRFATFEHAVDERVRDFEAQGKRKASSEELQNILDTTLLDKVFVEKWGTDPQLPLSAISAEDQKKAYVTVDKKDIKISSIPDDQRQIIINNLESRGRTVTESEIARLWVAANKPLK